jgi:hypothetical protein
MHIIHSLLFRERERETEREIQKEKDRTGVVTSI